MVVQGCQVQSCEPIVLCLIDAVRWRQVGEDETHGSNVTPQGSMMEGVETIVVRDGNISTPFQQQGDYVIPLLRDGVMQGRVSFSVL